MNLANTSRLSKGRLNLVTILCPLTALLLTGTAHAQAAKFKVVYNMPGQSGMGGGQGEAIAQSRTGSMYSTFSGGPGGVFVVTPKGKAAEFATSIGGYPVTGVLLGTDGNFYGCSQGGGANQIGLVFQITPDGVAKDIYDFTGYADGDTPQGALIQGSDGRLYGTTYYSRRLNGSNPGSVAFAVTTGGAFTTLHQFTQAEGYDISAGLVQGFDGNFYGTASQGGLSGYGTIFSMTPAGAVTVLHNFAGPEGAVPAMGLVQANDGNFYGATYGGGNDYGVIFRITPSGTYTPLYSFVGNTDGANPSAPLTLGSDGVLYGTTAFDGPLYGGTIFSMTTSGAFSLLYSFSNNPDKHGYNIYAPVQQNTDGVFFGDSFNGGTCNPSGGCGVIYTFNTGLEPFVRLVTGFAPEGVEVGMLGQGFSASSVVKFGGTTAAKVKRIGGGFLTATVPAAALTGAVTVTTGATTLTSNSTFRVTPVDSKFKPAKGKIGTAVSVSGSGFLQTSAVSFGGVAAAFTVESDTVISATVPSGAMTGPIVVTTLGGSATSSTDFTVD
jgi:uncharacterized repeat protein (TIGR03803 family)